MDESWTPEHRRRQLDRETLDAPDPGSSAGGARILRVLVIDDDQVDRMAVRRALSSTALTVDVSEADGVLPAIELLTTQAIDCVFLDYHLADGDGLTFLRGLRATGLSIPVVMLTGQADAEVAADLVRSGAADYIPKTLLTPERLAQSLRLALQIS